MRFFTDRIVNPAGKGFSFEDWLASEITKMASQNEKVASEAKPECDDDPRGQCRGQVINNDNENGAGYQKGESVSGKKEQGGNARPDSGGTTDQKEHKQSDKEAGSVADKTAKCGKEMGESGDAGKVTDKHTDAAPGDDESKVKSLINNDPNYQKGESVDPSKAVGKSKKGPGDSVVGKSKKSSSVSKFKKIASMSKEEKVALFVSMASRKQYPIQYIEAATGLKLAQLREIFSNMKEDEKSWFSDFWDILYPPEYVKEMVKDR